MLDQQDATDTTTEPGARASDPTDIPASGWKRVLTRTIAEIKDDNVGLMAGGVAFYGMLSLFPAIAATVMVYGLIADPQTVSSQSSEFLGALPSGARELIEGRLQEVAASSDGALGFGVLISIATALWSASAGMKGLIGGINSAYDEPESRGFLPLRGLALALTLGAIIAFILALGLVAILPAILSSLGLGSLDPIIQIGRWPLLAVLVMAGLAVLFRVAPDRDDPRFEWVTPGAVAATVLWLAGSALFSIYTANFGSYDETYGSLAAVIVLLLWFYLSGFVVLFGAELNAEAERQTAKDSTVGKSQPPGDRDADAADDVPPNSTNPPEDENR